MFAANAAIVAKKSPKSTKIPYVSTINPTNGHFRKIRRIPAMKAAVPLSFCVRAKNRKVFWKPMIRVRPMRNNIFIR